MAKPVEPADDLQDLLDTIPPPEPRTDLGNMPDDGVSARPDEDDERPEPSPAPEPAPEPEPEPAPELASADSARIAALEARLAAAEREAALARAGAQPTAPEPLLPFNVTEDDVNLILQGGPKAAQVMQAVLETVVRQAKESTAEQLRREYAQARTSEVAGQSLHQKFYGENPDLAPYAKIVGTIAQEVYATYPSATAQQLLQETAQRTRSQLRQWGVRLEGGQPAKQRIKPARGESGVGTRANRGATNLSSTERDVLDLVYRH